MARAKPRKTGHKSHDRVMEQDWQAKQKTAREEASKAGGVGHNSNMGQVNPDVQGLFSKYDEIEAAIKVLNKDKAAIRNQAKDEFGISKRVFAIELSLRKLDPTVRADIELEHTDLKAMLGYQMALNLMEENDEETPDPVEAAKNKVVGISKATKTAKATKEPKKEVEAEEELEEEEEGSEDEAEDNF